MFLTGETRNEDRQRNLQTDYFSINTTMAPFAVAVLVNSVFINVQANIAAEARRINMVIIFTNANYSQFTLNQYQEVCQKLAHKAMPKKNELFERVGNIAGKNEMIVTNIAPFLPFL